MADIILVRHGQANTHAQDEASYDQLSELGRQQAQWLGLHLRDTGARFDHVVTGTLSRQVETAREMGYAPERTDPRLNELTYFDLAQAVEMQFGLPAPNSAAEFARYMPQVVAYWAEDQLTGIPESFGSFEARVTHLLEELASRGGTSLVVTSGGVIGMALRHVLGLDTAAMADVMLHTMNSSVHHLRFSHGRLMLAGFNATPHLDQPERREARTFI